MNKAFFASVKDAIILISLSLLLFAISGCDSQTIIKIYKPNIKCEFTPRNINYGEKAIFSWEITGEPTFIWVNQTLINSSQGSIEVGPLLKDTTYVITAHNELGTFLNAAAVNVGDWTTSDFGLLTHDMWVVDTLYYKTSGTNWVWEIFDQDIFQGIKSNYLPSGEFNTYKNGILNTEGDWILSENTLKIISAQMTEIYVIEKLTQSVLIMMIESHAYNDPTNIIYFRFIYKRPA